MNKSPINWAKLNTTTIIAHGGVVGITAAIDAARADIAELHGVILHMQRALKPFASIRPSSCYMDDGSDKEGYQAFLCHQGSGAVASFDGGDLAAARAAMKMAADVLAEK
jgi:hypothetical protein